MTLKHDTAADQGAAIEDSRHTSPGLVPPGQGGNASVGSQSPEPTGTAFQAKRAEA